MGASYQLPSWQFPSLVSYWNIITTPEGTYLNISLIQIMKNVSSKLHKSSKSSMNYNKKSEY